MMGLSEPARCSRTSCPTGSPTGQPAQDAEKEIGGPAEPSGLADVGALVREPPGPVRGRLHRPPGRRGDRRRPAQAGPRGAEPGRRQAGRGRRGGGTTEKPSVVMVTTEGARKRGLKAGHLVRAASETLGGRGGGKDDIAQGGGTDGSRFGRRAQGGRGRHRRRDGLQAFVKGLPARRPAGRGLGRRADRRGACDADGLLAYPVATVRRRSGRSGSPIAALVADHGPGRGPGRSAAVAVRPGGPGRGEARDRRNGAGWRRAIGVRRSGWSTSGSPRSPPNRRCRERGENAQAAAPWSTRPRRSRSGARSRCRARDWAPAGGPLVSDIGGRRREPDGPKPQETHQRDIDARPGGPTQPGERDRAQGEGLSRGDRRRPC